jgi:hypothetical protein
MKFNIKFLVYIKVTGENATILAAPVKSSGFADTKGGVLPNVHILREPSGVICQHPGHLGGTRNVGIKSLICQNCSHRTHKEKETPPIKSLSTVWTFPTLKKIRSTRPIFFVILVSRSSGSIHIPKSKFKQLKEVIITNER